jgi:Na+/melibiose symporter-like transporter
MSVGLLSFFSFLTGTGSCTAFSAAIKTSTYNWPLHRGTASAFPLSAFGLSAFVFTLIANVAFGDSPSSYLLMLAIGTLILNSVSIIFIRLIPTDVRDDQSDDGRGRSSSRLRYRSHSDDRAEGHSADAEPSEGDTLVSRASTSEDFDPDEEARKHTAREEAQHVEMTGITLLKQFKFWQLFLMLGLLSGVGLMTINNIGNDAASLWRQYDPSKPRAFVRGREQMHVSILSVCSSLGRLASGIGSDMLVKRLRASRIWCLTTSASIFAVAQLLALVIRNPNFLFLVSGLTGLAYGALFGVFPSITADAFGVQGLSLNWGFVIFAPVLSGNVYNLCYGRILDSNTGPDGVCDKGLLCYTSAYWITLASSLAGAVVSIWCIRYEALARRRRAALHRGVLATS